MKKILFVCLGNICRSTMAEGVMLQLVEEQNAAENWKIESAGTASYHVGELADYRTRNVLLENGFDLKSRARKVRTDDFYEFDYIFAMDKNNLDDLEAIRPKDSTANVLLFRSFDPFPETLEVPDPYYGTMADFYKVHEMVLRTCKNLIGSELK